jgi:hypothetical protein
VFKADQDWGAVQMSTIPVTNLTDTPVAGETDLRQAITQAHNGDTIVLASGDFGELIQLKSRLIVSAGANLTIDFGAGEDNGIDGSIMVDAGATATMANMFITDEDIGADSPDRPANGEGGVAGMAGASGDPGSPVGTEMTARTGSAALMANRRSRLARWSHEHDHDHGAGDRRDGPTPSGCGGQERRGHLAREHCSAQRAADHSAGSEPHDRRQFDDRRWPRQRD